MVALAGFTTRISSYTRSEAIMILIYSTIFNIMILSKAYEHSTH